MNPQEIFDSMVAGGRIPDDVFAMLAPVLGRDKARAALQEHEKRAGRIYNLTDPLVIHEPGKRPWYVGPREEDRFWPGLKQYLLEKGWWDDVVDSIDRASSKILANMEPAGLPEIDTRGLVVGYVQSGKTANFTAVIAKAADVGYRLFIVLAGIHNSLRRQTHKRLYQELVDLNREYWATLTSDQEDFRASAGGNTDVFLSQKSSVRILCIVKKNHAVLRRLEKWLRAGSPSVLNQCPVLIIDDEADQAGLNASRDPEQRTVTNRLILDIMKALPKAAYVGYTATPFANVLVDPSGEDLYPKDFIVELPRPDGYFGAEHLFGRLNLPLDEDEMEREAELDMIRPIPDEEVPLVRPRGAKDKDSFEPEVAGSLEAALRYFALATAARRVRGQSGHSSMLVHTTLYTEAHDRLANVISLYWSELSRALKTGDTETLDSLREQWERESALVPSQDLELEPVAFDTLRDHLAGVLDDTKIVVENSASLDRLSYEEAGEVQIAVGGNTLSRGLTLEGLVTSYFVRSASAYDTLLQMGRWFGYRRGYEDFPRIWMTADLERSFRSLATVEEEIRRDIRRYDDGASPTDLAVRIRTHPTLAVTSVLKMRHAIECEISYGGGTRQNTVFDLRRSDRLRENLRAADELVESLGTPKMHETGRLYWEDVPAEKVLGFLTAFQFSEGRPDLNSESLKGYIEDQRREGCLQSWTIVLASVKQGRKGTLPIGGVEVNLLNRSRLNRSGEYTAIGTVTTQQDLQIGIPDGRTQRKEPDDPPALLLYPIAKDSEPGPRGASNQKRVERVALNAPEHVLAVALDFPPAAKPTPQKYVKVDLPVPQQDEEEAYDVESDEE